MTQEDIPPAPPRRRFGRRMMIAVIAVIALAAVLVGALNVPAVQRLALHELGGLRTESGLGVTVGRFHGSLLSSATLEDIAVRDQHGIFAHIPVLALRWSPAAGLLGRIEIDRLRAPEAQILRKPDLLPTPPTDEPLLPNIDIALGSLRIDRLTLGQALMEGDARIVRVDAAGTLYKRVVDLRASVTAEEGGDLALLDVRASEASRQFDLEARAVSPKGGALARIAGLPEGFALIATGDGDWMHWRGPAGVDRRQASGYAAAESDGRPAERRRQVVRPSAVPECRQQPDGGRGYRRPGGTPGCANAARRRPGAGRKRTDRRQGRLNLDTRAVTAAALEARLPDSGACSPTSG
ncbi:hypothetical protein E6W36_15370 [Hankyongella ginsenosidimutans]|uniref:Uncharacterized protein n=1 Tax=Hankyongella ginsenosidimutans TaxID=1763828 RepID=A0A4D7CBY1_9SPHN|nr:hypothetical protein [Hankyongella ginsenosidimutans]QCI80396.1 hypothetical protein E6W36_15370 [Hankyongella ginsenosidimutans]